MIKEAQIEKDKVDYLPEVLMKKWDELMQKLYVKILTWGCKHYFELYKLFKCAWLQSLLDDVLHSAQWSSAADGSPLLTREMKKAITKDVHEKLNHQDEQVRAEMIEKVTGTIRTEELVRTSSNLIAWEEREALCVSSRAAWLAALTRSKKSLELRDGKRKPAKTRKSRSASKKVINLVLKKEEIIQSSSTETSPYVQSKNASPLTQEKTTLPSTEAPASQGWIFKNNAV